MSGNSGNDFDPGHGCAPTPGALPPQLSASKENPIPASKDERIHIETLTKAYPDHNVMNNKTGMCETSTIVFCVKA